MRPDLNKNCQLVDSHRLSRPTLAKCITGRLAAAPKDDCQASRNDPRTPKLSIRIAVEKYHVPKSTLHGALRSQIPGEPGRKPELTGNEESTILQTVLSFSDRGIPMIPEQVAEAVELLIEHLPESRRQEIPFRSGKLGR